MNCPHPPAPSPKRGEGGQDLAFKVPLPLWERDLGRGNDIRARGLFLTLLGRDRKLKSQTEIATLMQTIREPHRLIRSQIKRLVDFRDARTADQVEPVIGTHQIEIRKAQGLRLIS